jgi:hypothetical protein
MRRYGRLVLAAGMDDCKDHEIRIGEKPFARTSACSFGSARESAQVFVTGETTEVLEADTGERRNLFFGEELLARLDPDHLAPSVLSDAGRRLTAA